MRPEDDAAATVVRGTDGALARAAGALLAVRLLAAAADLATGLGVAGPGSPARQLGGHDLVEDGSVDGGREELVTELHAADGRARPVEDVDLRHRSGLLHEDQATAGAGKAPLDQQQIAFGIGTDDADLLDGHALVAHVAGHLQAAVDTAGRRARADRSRRAVMVGAVRLGPAMEVVALDVARETLALGDAGDVDEIARGEQVAERERLADADAV